MVNGIIMVSDRLNWIAEVVPFDKVYQRRQQKKRTRD